MKDSARSRLGVLLAAAVTGCGGGYHSAVQDSIAQAGRAGGDASEVTMTWTAVERQAVDRGVDEGIVALVPVANGQFGIAGGCFPGRRYRYQGNSMVESSFDSSSSTTDGISAPLAGAILGSSEESGEKARIRLISVGRFTLEGEPIPPGAAGAAGCENPAYVLTTVEVGAFEMHHEATSSDGGGVDMLAAGVQSDSRSTAGSLTKEGDPEACRTATRKDVAPPEQCRVPIRVALQSLIPPPAVETPQASDEGQSDEEPAESRVPEEQPTVEETTEGEGEGEGTAAEEADE